MTPSAHRILVWNELQRVPATVYGDARWGPDTYTISIHLTQTKMDAARARDPDAICYYFPGSGGGSGGGLAISQ